VAHFTKEFLMSIGIDPFFNRVIYTPNDWYWLHPDGQVYGSKAGAKVPTTDLDYQAWLAKGSQPTQWPQDASGQVTNEALLEVLRPHKLDPDSRVQTLLDDFAKAKGYNDISTACSYATSNNSAWAAEGQKAVQVRDSVWSAFIESDSWEVSWESLREILDPLLTWDS
jgi:hypothetical protein